jgi:hypothetical protein
MVSNRKRVIAIGVAVVAASAGLAYSMAPSSSRAADAAWLAGVSGIHEVVGRQQYDTSARKQAIAQCKSGEAAISGGWILAGDFQHAVPANTPMVTESGPAYRGDIGGGTVPRLWSVIAVAPTGFSGSWGLTAKAICVKAAR